MDATEYSAVPRTDYPLTVITEEEYQPVAPSHPLVASQPWPSTHDSRAAQQQQRTKAEEEPTVIPGTAILREAVKPRNYLVLSLINLLLCCCLPLGIIGLICSLRVNLEFAAGRYEQARNASETAKNINCIGIYISILIISIFLVLIFVDVVVAILRRNEY